jgi:hypothetical protein
LKHYIPWLTLNTSTGKLALGPRTVRRSFARQLATHRHQARTYLAGVPVVLGEIGIPFDLDGGRAYRTGDYRAQLSAADRSLRAVEDTLLDCTWWNYTAENDHQHGDQWNGEDLSIFSRNEQHEPADPNSGGRALTAIVRPYPRAVAGEPLALRFNPRTSAFRFTFRHDSAVDAPTLLFVPNMQYPDKYKVSVTDGTYESLFDQQLLIYHHTTTRAEHTIELRRRSFHIIPPRHQCLAL